jgi:hypothetical protein
VPSNHPHDHMILRVHLVGSHERWKRPCLQTTHMAIKSSLDDAGIWRCTSGWRRIVCRTRAVE